MFEYYLRMELKATVIIHLLWLFYYARNNVLLIYLVIQFYSPDRVFPFSGSQASYFRPIWLLYGVDSIVLPHFEGHLMQVLNLL